MSQRQLKVLESDSWLVVDTETTGRGDGAEVVELAIVDSRGEILFESLIRPAASVTAGAERVHGLSVERLGTAPSLAAVYDEVHELIAGRNLFAYNAGFDRRVLTTSCARAGQPAFPANWFCALDLYESLRGFRPTLGTACEIEGVVASARRHRAAADAVALQRLLVKLREVVGREAIL